MRIQSVTLYHVDIPMRFAFRTAKETLKHRESIILEVADESGQTGYGEVVSFTSPFYTMETLEASWEALKTSYIPQILDKDITHPFEIHKMFERKHPMAIAGLENALLDIYTKQREENLIKSVFQENLKKEIGLGIVLGDLPVQELLLKIQEFYGQGCRRIKIKIKPEDGFEKMKQVTACFPEIDSAVDANRSFPVSRIEDVIKFDKLGLLCIEEPFMVDSLEEYRGLQTKIKTPICLDESIQTMEELKRAIQYEAFQVLNIKIGRVGGLFYVKQMIQYCRTQGIRYWIGSMVESGISKILHVQLAALTDTYMEGDLSDSRRYFDQDFIVPEIIFENGKMKCPEGNGLGVKINKSAILKQAVETLKVGR